MSKTIFFDIGNTLATGAGESARRLLGSRLALSEKEVKLVGRSIMTCPSSEPRLLAAALEPILPHHPPNHIRSIVETVWNEQVDCVKEVEGAAVVLKSLKADGFRLGLISNTWHPFYEGFRKNCGEIVDVLDYTILSYRVGCKKPSPELYRRAVAESGEPASACWMIGDSYELDMEPSQHIGMHTVWILVRVEREKHILSQLLRTEKRAPDYVVEELGDILPFFRKGAELC